MSYDYKGKKIVVLLTEELESWQAMNTVGHLSIALGANKDEELMGRPVFLDASHVEHLGIARYGLIIKKADSRAIAETLRAGRLQKAIKTIDFPREMLETRHDDELEGAMSAKKEEDFDYLGALFYGDSKVIDELTKSFPLWK